MEKNKECISVNIQCLSEMSSVPLWIFGDRGKFVKL